MIDVHCALLGVSLRVYACDVYSFNLKEYEMEWVVELMMMVLRTIHSPDMVWCFFGEEYAVERVRNTCAKWTEQESAFFQWLSSSSFTGKEKNSRSITRETAKGNGTTTKRKPSTGDLLYTPKGE